MMRRILVSILAGLAALFGAPACAQDAPVRDVAAQQDYAIINVTVVPMDSERHIPGQTVIVRDGRIAEIVPAGQADLADGVTVIEGEGRYLMPGLAEMHAHVPPDPNATQWTEDVLFLYAANGITFARGMLGAPHHIALREQLADGEILGPRLYTSGPSFNGGSVASPEAARRMVADQKAAGYDFLKIHPGLDRARYDAMAEAAREHDIPFGGHVPEAVGIERVLAVGQATIDHLDGYMSLLVPPDRAASESGLFGYNLTPYFEPARIAEAVRRTREAGVWNVPTDSLMHHVLLPGASTEEMTARPEMRYVPREMLAGWAEARSAFQGDAEYDPEQARRYVEARAQLIAALQNGGAGLLLGSDAPQWFNVPGFSLHRELGYLVDAGLSPYQALATGTRNVATFLGTDDFGTVEAGKRADLILLEADPLADIANVSRRAGVMLNGRWLPQSDIEAGLAAIAARYAE